MFRPTQSTGPRAALAVSFAFALTATFAVPQAAAEDPFGNKFNHYECYPVGDGTTKIPDAVKLSDQFRSDAAFVVQAVTLCNPVDKNGEGIPEEKLHLVCYTIKVDNPDPKEIHHVVIVNQLEKNQYWVRGPETLCVPSLKEVVK